MSTALSEQTEEEGSLASLKWIFKGLATEDKRNLNTNTKADANSLTCGATYVLTGTRWKNMSWSIVTRPCWHADAWLHINTHAHTLSACAHVLKQTCEVWTDWILKRRARKKLTTTWKLVYWSFLCLNKVEFTISTTNQPFSFCTASLIGLFWWPKSKCFSVFRIVQFAQCLQLSSRSSWKCMRQLLCYFKDVQTISN